MERHQDFRDFEEIGIHRNEARAGSKQSTPSKKRTEGPKRAATETEPLGPVSSPTKKSKTSTHQEPEA